MIKLACVPHRGPWRDESNVRYVCHKSAYADIQLDVKTYGFKIGDNDCPFDLIARVGQGMSVYLSRDYDGPNNTIYINAYFKISSSGFWSGEGTVGDNHNKINFLRNGSGSHLHKFTRGSRGFCLNGKGLTSWDR